MVKSPFPTAEVIAILGFSAVDVPGHLQHFSGLTLAELQKLVEIEAADPDDAQNASPTIREFLDDLEPYAAKAKLIGYVVYPPRDDARITIEGFTADGLTADETVKLAFAYAGANEASYEKADDGTYSVRFWWD